MLYSVQARLEAACRHGDNPFDSGGTGARSDPSVEKSAGLEKGAPHEVGRLAKVPYRVTRPQVTSFLQTVGTPFDATGALNPALAPGDTSTMALVQVFQIGRRGATFQVATVDATFTGLDANGNTGYSATVTLADRMAPTMAMGFSSTHRFLMT